MARYLTLDPAIETLAGTSEDRGSLGLQRAWDVCGLEPVVLPPLNVTHPQRALILPLHVLGLANRLRTLAGAWLLARETGRALVLDWQPATTCNARWEDLFEPLPTWRAEEGAQEPGYRFSPSSVPLFRYEGPPIDTSLGMCTVRRDGKRRFVPCGSLTDADRSSTSDTNVEIYDRVQAARRAGQRVRELEMSADIDSLPLPLFQFVRAVHGPPTQPPAPFRVDEISIGTTGPVRLRHLPCRDVLSERRRFYRDELWPRLREDLRVRVRRRLGFDPGDATARATALRAFRVGVHLRVDDPRFDWNVVHVKPGVDQSFAEASPLARFVASLRPIVAARVEATDVLIASNDPAVAEHLASTLRTYPEFRGIRTLVRVLRPAFPTEPDVAMATNTSTSSASPSSSSASSSSSSASPSSSSSASSSSSTLMDRRRPAAIRSAMVDFWTLAHCNVLLRSFYSSFSDEASQVNGIPLISIRTENPLLSGDPAASACGIYFQLERPTGAFGYVGETGCQQPRRPAPLAGPITSIQLEYRTDWDAVLGDIGLIGDIIVPS